MGNILKFLLSVFTTAVEERDGSVILLGPVPAYEIYSATLRLRGEFDSL